MYRWRCFTVYVQQRIINRAADRTVQTIDDGQASLNDGADSQMQF